MNRHRGLNCRGISLAGTATLLSVPDISPGRGIPFVREALYINRRVWRKLKSHNGTLLHNPSTTIVVPLPLHKGGKREAERLMLKS